MQPVVSYMGTKRSVASAVARIVSELPGGPMLDVFSGMGAVGCAVAPTRQVWTNDWMVFPALVCGSLFTSTTAPLDRAESEDALEANFGRNRQSLLSRFEKRVTAERRALDSGVLERMRATSDLIPYAGTDYQLKRERSRLSRNPTTFPYRLVTTTYAGGFFGLLQSIELDALRFAIDEARADRRVTGEQRQFLLVAAASAAARINCSTGHFAEFMRPTAKNLSRFLQKRRRSVWSDFLDAVENLEAVGSQAWRSRNRSFRRDAADLLSVIRRSGARPAVIYADPPYSKAQYSRYYHVLEELVLYRYPAVSGAGRYPPGRKRSEYGLRSRVMAAIDRLVREAASIKACLVFSYPSNGLLETSGPGIRSVLEGYYSHIDLAYSADHSHSTFGASRTGASNQVRERVYLGRI